MLKNLHGIKVLSVRPKSIAFIAGLKKGDSVLSVNGEVVEDDLDFRFYSAQPNVNVLVERKNQKLSIAMDRSSGGELGIRFKDRPIRRCCNKCVFCFIDQMPLGLRKTLYIKDEDYRYSFTNGNYLTLSTTTRAQLGHIIDLGLSPLFISVHATDASVRKKLLGNPRAISIVEQLRFLELNNISFHTQIVVCPGINDGKVLAQSIKDLLRFKHGLLSIAVVPVGLTKHRTMKLEAVTLEGANKICQDVGAMSDADCARRGVRRIFLADEFFIKAGLSIPPETYYEYYPQIENGVGLIRQLLSEWKLVKKGLKRADTTPKIKSKKTNCLVLTSFSAFDYVKKIMGEMQQIFSNVQIAVTPVKNTFFGEDVTVAGLLTAFDVMRTVKLQATAYSTVFIPSVMFNIRGYTMDGYSKARIEKRIAARLLVVSNLEEIVSILHFKKSGL